jgi:hypothetical protein
MAEADIREISCSADRPPKIRVTEIFLDIRAFGTTNSMV